MTGLPFRPGDWAQDGADRVARVLRVYEDRGEVVFDLIMFGDNGDKLGRVSPACGGPRTFEPYCSIDGWRRIKEPEFPLTLKWVSDGNGGRVARRWAGETQPPANYTPKPRRVAFVRRPADDPIRKALEEIAAGHNDARQLAKDTLGLK